MIPILIDTDEITIKNIEINELNKVLNCVNQSRESIKALGRDKIFSLSDIKQRYLESLVNSLEFFCGVYMNRVLIGVIKGRIENKSSRELYIFSFVLIEEYQHKGIGTNVLSAFEMYFSDNYSIKKFCALVMNDNISGQHFWTKNQYFLARVTQGVDKDGEVDISIFEKWKNK